LHYLLHLEKKLFSSGGKIAVLLSLFAIVSLSACSLTKSGENESTNDKVVSTKDDATLIDKAPPQVETKILNAETIKNRLKDGKYKKQDADGDAFTEWFYSCTIDLDTEDVFRDDTAEASSTAIRVKGVKFKLALPILIMLPNDADPALVKHENGHVAICSIIYGHVDQACKDGARAVVGKTFNGMGKDLPSAKQMALSQVYRIIKTSFATGTTVPTIQASKLYDSICQRHAQDKNFDCLAAAEQCCKGFVDRHRTVIK